MGGVIGAAGGAATGAYREQLETEGRLGKLADQHYSFMGFQDSNLTDWRRDQAPEVAQRLQDAGVSALILAPA